MTYLILRRNLGRNFKSLTYVASVSAKDAVNCNWSGLSRYCVYGLNLNYA